MAKSDWYGTGSKVKVLTREYERNHPDEPFEPEHPPICPCLMCTRDRQMDAGGVFGRYDAHSLVKPHLQRAAELREEIARTPRSTGGAGYKRAEVAGAAQERTVSPSPTVDLKGAA